MCLSTATGSPVRYRTTRVTGVFAKALALRNLLWHQRDLGVRVASIQVARPKQKEKMEQKPRRPATSTFPSGPVDSFDSGRTVADQLAWLREKQSESIATYPSNLAALTREAGAAGISLPALKQLQVIQHSLSDIEIKVVPGGRIDEATESRLLAAADTLGREFSLRLSYVDDIPRPASGKFEDFRSLVASP